MKIQVLGSGCSNCKNLYDITQKAVADMHLDAEILYITGNEGMQKMIAFGAMTSPVLVVNERIAMTGYTPDVETIKEKIRITLQSA